MREEPPTSVKALAVGCLTNLLAAVTGAVLACYAIPEDAFFPSYQLVMARFVYGLGGFVVGSIVGAFLAWRIALWVDKPVRKSVRWASEVDPRIYSTDVSASPTTFRERMTRPNSRNPTTFREHIVRPNPPTEDAGESQRG